MPTKPLLKMPPWPQPYTRGQVQSIRNEAAYLQTQADTLRYQARLAYLDGRTARCKELHLRANRLDRHATKLRTVASERTTP
jgi:hypothetical protein